MEIIMTPFRVMQVTETGEEFWAFGGDTQKECEAWIDANENNFPESQFYVEEVECLDFWA